MSRAIASVLVCALATGAQANQFWNSFDASVLPEQDGWTRVYQSPGGSRSIHNGVFTLDTLGQPAMYDYYLRETSVILDPGEELMLEWSARVTGSIHDTWVQIGQGGSAGGIGVSIGHDAVQVGDTVSLPITPGVFHSYQLATSDMRNFRLLIDGVQSWAYPPGAAYQPQINVLFGDWTFGSGSGTPSSRSEWDYVRFGVVPAPATILSMAILLAPAAMTRRRRDE